jgi:hypothetical protein
LLPPKVPVHLTQKSFLFILRITEVLFLNNLLALKITSLLDGLFQMLKFIQIVLKQLSFLLNRFVIVNEGQEDLLDQNLVHFEDFVELEVDPKDLVEDSVDDCEFEYGLRLGLLQRHSLFLLDLFCYFGLAHQTELNRCPVETL